MTFTPLLLSLWLRITWPSPTIQLFGTTIGRPKADTLSNRISNRLYLDMDWTAYEMGQFLIVDAYQVIDPAIYPALWGERTLQNYACALIKVQWAGHLNKYQNFQMAGGNIYNGAQLYAQARQELKEEEENMRKFYEMPPQFEIG